MDILASIPVTMCLGKAGLFAGTTTTLSSSNAVDYGIEGKAYTHAALSNTATPTTDAATGDAFNGVLANYGSVFTIGYNAAGTLSAVQGTIEALNASGSFINAPQFGAIPDDFCPIGYLVIKAGSTANNTTGWVFGTSNMSGVTGVTYTFVDVITLPDRPQVS
jgi:hypothetical protein